MKIPVLNRGNVFGENILRLFIGTFIALKGILYHLPEGTLRFNERKRRIGNVTQRMLTKQLRELKADEIISRHIYAQVPPKVEYSRTEKGQSLRPILLALKQWGMQNRL